MHVFSVALEYGRVKVSWSICHLVKGAGRQEAAAGCSRHAAECG